jgi:hypothetical protein
VLECEELSDVIKMKIAKRIDFRYYDKKVTPCEDVELYNAIPSLISGKTTEELGEMIYTLLCVIDEV